MKKFIVTLLIFILLGAGVFIVGWIQVFLPAGSHTVIHTKTKGFEEKVFTHDTFTWRWERLIPTNLKMYSFQLEPVEISNVRVRGTLPSGGTYSSVLADSPDFAYDLEFNLRMFLAPENLPQLVEKEAVEPETISDWHIDKSIIVVGLLEQFILKEPDSVFRSGYLAQWEKMLLENESLSAFQKIEITPVNVTVPDMDLYNEAKRIYFALANAREEKDLTAIQSEQVNLAALKDYGELLTEYPILIQYLYLKELKGEALPFLETGESAVGQ